MCPCIIQPPPHFLVRTPLHLACAQGDVNIATHLLSCKAKVNLCDVDGRTALMKVKFTISGHACM